MLTLVRGCFVFAVIVTAGAQAADKPNGLACQPSRGCAIEMARQAARKNHELTKNNHVHAMTLLQIAQLQHAAGDMPGFTATVSEMRPVVAGMEGRKDEKDYRAHLAAVQAQVGLLDEALATVGSMRDAKERSQGYRSVAAALARAGRWRDAVRIAKDANREEKSGSPEAEVMWVLIDTGRRDWVSEALPVLTPGNEAFVLARVAIRAGDFAAARTEALRIADLQKRLQIIEEIGQELEKKQAWDELAITARLIPPEATKLTNVSWRAIHLEIAAEWLTKGGAFDDALALVPALDANERQSVLAEIARQRALAGDYRKSIEMLGTIESDWRDDVLTAIAVAKVIAGDEKHDQALSSLPNSSRRLQALELLGEMLSDARRDEARAVLSQAAELAAREDVEYRDTRLRDYAEMQAGRGFFDHALKTAQQIHTTEELLAAFGHIGIAQASQGLTEPARKTFSVAESQARKYGFDGEAHAQLTEALARAGLLPEAFAQVQAMSGRDRDDWWYDQELDPVIRAHVAAGQLSRAFQIATLMTARDPGNPNYFMMIAAAPLP